jgi:hypothetical protein
MSGMVFKKSCARLRIRRGCGNFKPEMVWSAISDSGGEGADWRDSQGVVHGLVL